MSFDINADTAKIYWQLKLGAYTPTGDLEDATFESSGNIQIVYDRYILPKYAIQGGLSMFVSVRGKF
jgi:hypothetical protein